MEYGRSQWMLRTLIAVSLVVLPVVGFAETSVGSTTAPGSVSETVAQPTNVGTFGFFETRPTLTTDTGEVHTENTAQVGYNLDVDTTITAIQYFNTELANSNRTSSPSAIYAKDLWVYYQRANLWKSADGNDSFGVREQFILPTEAADRDLGFIGSFRQYLMFNHKFSEVFDIDLWEVPVLHAYNRAEGKPGVGNDWFENRLYVTANLAITKKLAFSIPFILETHRTRGIQGNDGQWKNVLWTWPTLTYAVADNAQIGLAWESDNLVNDGMTELTDAGIKAGLFQTILNIKL